MPSLNIKAIVFDAYGTLLDISSIDQLLTDLFGQKSGLIARLWRQKQLEYTWLRTLMERYVNFQQITEDALIYATRVADVGLAKSEQQTLMEAYNQLEIYSEVKQALEALGAHYQLAVLSNANQAMLEKAIAHNGIHALFEAVISVEETGLYKPRPEVYALAQQKFCVERSQLLFISSNTWDVAGARSFGLKVAWANRFNNEMEELGFEPDLIVSDLKELSDYLILPEND